VKPRRLASTAKKAKGFFISHLLEIKGARPPNGVTTVKDVSPGSVPSRSSVTSGFQNVTLPKLLIVIGVDNEAPDTATFGEDLDVFGSHLVGDFLVELGNHLLVDIAENVSGDSGRRTTRSPIKIVFFDVLNQDVHFVVHIVQTPIEEPFTDFLSIL